MICEPNALEKIYEEAVLYIEEQTPYNQNNRENVQ